MSLRSLPSSLVTSPPWSTPWRSAPPRWRFPTPRSLVRGVGDGPPGGAPSPARGDAHRARRRAARPRLGAFLGDDDVALFPAWDTLPFERVSPELSTHGPAPAAAVAPGRPGPRPAVVVAPVRALLQRAGGVEEAAVPIVLARAAGSTSRSLVAGARRPRLPARVPGRTPGQLAVRGGIIDVYLDGKNCPCASTCGATRSIGSPSSTPGDQRSIADLDGVELFGCREVLAPPRPCAPGRRRWWGPAVGRGPVGAPGRARSSTAWNRGAVARRRRAGPARPRQRGRAGASCSSIPAAVRDRAAELNNKKAGLGHGARRDVGVAKAMSPGTM